MAMNEQEIKGFDADGKLDPGFLIPGRAGKLLAELCAKQRPYTKSQILRLWEEHGFTVYYTPLGRLVHRNDVVEAARRIGWHRKEPVAGFLGGNPWCAGSGEGVDLRISDEMPKCVACPTCGWVFDAKWSASYNSRGTVACYTSKIPTHKDRREKNLQ